MGYSQERTANAYARALSKIHKKYISVFFYKGKWYLTDCYAQR